MSVGLAALLDDIAAIAKVAAASIDDIGPAAAKASSKAVGVVVDDTAVTPRYVTGFTPDRELPIIKKITIGSLRNKLLLILPLVLLLSQFASWALTPLLMVGGTYLCFEGAEKLWEKLSGHEEHDTPVGESGGDVEAQMVGGAIRTDFILSSEIMVIALAEVADQPILTRAMSLVVVAILITLGVYGFVALIVKMDDIGLHLAKEGSAGRRALGRGLVAFMPKLLAALAVVGTLAMLWVGGHILLVGLDTLGWHGPYSIVHHVVEAVAHATGPLGGVLGWTTNALLSAVAGSVVGAVVVAIVQLVHRGRGSSAHVQSNAADEER